MRSYGIDVRGARYFVRERGQGQPLLLLHGFTGSGADFLPFFRALSGQWRVIAIDLPGHGQTSVLDASRGPERMSLPSISADLLAVCEQIGAAHPVVFGYSLGGRIALGVAAEHPLWPTALILESASPGLATVVERSQRQASDERLAQVLEADGLASFLTYWQSVPLFATQQTVVGSALRRQHRHRLKQRAEALAASLRGSGVGSQPSYWPSLSQIRLPVLLLTGEQDLKFAAIASGMAQFMPNAAHRIIPHAGHNTHLEFPAVWLSEVQTFLLLSSNHAENTLPFVSH